MFKLPLWRGSRKRNRNRAVSAAAAEEQKITVGDKTYGALLEAIMSETKADSVTARLDSDVTLTAAVVIGSSDYNGQFKEPMTVTAKNVTNDPNFNQLIRDYLNEPLDPKSLAAQVSSREQALDLYRLSAAAIVADNQAEQNYLNALAAALGLDGSTKLQLDQESAQLRLQLAQQ